MNSSFKLQVKIRKDGIFYFFDEKTSRAIDGSS